MFVWFVVRLWNRYHDNGLTNYCKVVVSSYQLLPARATHDKEGRPVAGRREGTAIGVHLIQAIKRIGQAITCQPRQVARRVRR